MEKALPRNIAEDHFKSNVRFTVSSTEAASSAG